MAQAVADVPDTGLASKPEDPVNASEIKEDGDGPSRESAVSAACLACVSGRSSFIYSSPTSLGSSMTAFGFLLFYLFYLCNPPSGIGCALLQSSISMQLCRSTRFRKRKVKGNCVGGVQSLPNQKLSLSDWSRLSPHEAAKKEDRNKPPIQPFVSPASLHNGPEIC